MISCCKRRIVGEQIDRGVLIVDLLLKVRRSEASERSPSPDRLCASDWGARKVIRKGARGRAASRISGTWHFARGGKVMPVCVCQANGRLFACQKEEKPVWRPCHGGEKGDGGGPQSPTFRSRTRVSFEKMRKVDPNHRSATAAQASDERVVRRVGLIFRRFCGGRRCWSQYPTGPWGNGAMGTEAASGLPTRTLRSSR